LPEFAPQMPVTARNVPYNTNEARAEFWRNYDGLTTKNQQDIAAVVSRAINEVETQVLSNIDAGQYTMFDVAISDQTTERINAACNDAVKRTAEQLAKDLEGNAVPLTGPYGQSIAQLAADSATKIEDSLNVITDDVRKVITANAQKDKNELRAILTERFKSVYSESRLKAIANTTAASVTSGSQLATYKRLGYNYIWLTEQDGRVRPSHALMEGRVVGSDGYFEVPIVKITKNPDGSEQEQIIGYERTERPLGDGLSASGAVNCRCQLFPVKQ